LEIWPYGFHAPAEMIEFHFSSGDVFAVTAVFVFLINVTDHCVFSWTGILENNSAVSAGVVIRQFLLAITTNPAAATNLARFRNNCRTLRVHSSRTGSLVTINRVHA